MVDINKVSFDTGKKNIKITGDITPPSLRDKILRIIDRAHLDFAPEYIKAHNNEKDSQNLAADGLIRTTVGYFRLVEDMENNNKLLLFSPGSDNLTGVFNPDTGNLKLPTDPVSKKINDHVYLVSAKKGEVAGSHFRNEMMSFQEKLKKMNLFDLNLAMEDSTPQPNEDNPKPLKVFKLTNNKAALGLFETSEGKWKMRLYSNLRGDWDETGKFVEIEETIPEGFTSLGNKAFGLGQDYNKEFESFNEIFTEAKRYWNISAMRMWKGQELLSEARLKPNAWKNSVNKIKKQLLCFTDHRKYRSYAVASAIALVSGAATIFAGPVGFIGAIGAMAAAAGGGVAVKLFEDSIVKKINEESKKKDQKRIDQKKALSEQDLSNDYIEQSPRNLKRTCKKITTESLERLRLLSYKESAINFDNGIITPTRRKNWEADILLSLPNRIFGNISEPLNENTTLTYYPNGIISLTNVDYETNKTTSFFIHSKNNVVSDNAPHRDGVEDILKNGKIIKILHEPDKPASIREVGPKYFKRSLSRIFNKESVDMRKKYSLKLSRMFNNAVVISKNSAPVKKHSPDVSL